MTKNRILVVEDNVLNLELVTDLLELKGFMVHSAATAEQALRQARELMPDLILMDVSLPGVDGLAATRILRSDPATRHLTIVALTAHAMRGDEQLALEAGCDGYLPKPIDTRKFASQITTFVAEGTARRSESTIPCQYAN